MNQTVTATPQRFRAIEEGIRRVSAKLDACSREDVVLMQLVTHLARNYDEMINRVIRPRQLNHVMFKTLLMAFGSPENEVNPSRLSAATGESRANMTRICDELCERGLIERHASEADRRRVVVSLTSAGERVVRDMLPRIGKQQRLAHALLSAAEKGRLETSLKKLLAGVEAVLDDTENM